MTKFHMNHHGLVSLSFTESYTHVIIAIISKKKQ